MDFVIKVIWFPGAFIITFALSMYSASSSLPRILHELSVPRTAITPIVIVIAVFITLLVTLYIVKHIRKRPDNIWKSTSIKVASTCMLLGHLGIASMVVLALKMETGGASGLFFIPSILWTLAWYAIGAIVSLVKISDTNGKTRKA